MVIFQQDILFWTGQQIQDYDAPTNQFYSTLSAGGAMQNTVPTNFYLGPRFLLSWEVRGMSFYATGLETVSFSVTDRSIDITNIIPVIITSVCYAGYSMVETENGPKRVRDIKTDDKIKSLIPGQSEYKYVPVIHNVVSWSTNRIVCLYKGCIAPGEPNKNLHITGGHNVRLANGESCKAANVIGSKVFKADNLVVYTIITSEPSWIIVNGLHVWADGKDYFNIKVELGNITFQYLL